MKLTIVEENGAIVAAFPFEPEQTSGERAPSATGVRLLEGQSSYTADVADDVVERLFRGNGDEDVATVLRATAKRISD